jgi:hypothetical protein
MFITQKYQRFYRGEETRRVLYFMVILIGFLPPAAASGQGRWDAAAGMDPKR